MSERLTPEARVALASAYVIARISRSQTIETEHLLVGIVRENPAFLNRFLKVKVSEDSFLEMIRHSFSPGEEISKLLETVSPTRSEECEHVIELATEEAKEAGRKDIGIDHLLIAILREEKSAAAKMLRERGADFDLIRIQLAAAPHEAPSEQEQKIRALNRMLSLLDNSDPTTRAKIAEIRDQLERGEEVTDASDEIMQIMADKARADRNPENSSGSSNLISEKVRRLLFFAQFQAKRSSSSEVETGHLLLTILREQKKHLNLFMPLADSKEAVCAEIEETLRTTENILPLEATPAAARPSLSEECNRAKVYAREEASMLFASRICPEHLLLGLLREEDSFASRLMRKYGAELEKIRAGLAASSAPSGTDSDERLQ